MCDETKQSKQTTSIHPFIHLISSRNNYSMRIQLNHIFHMSYDNSYISISIIIAPTDSNNSTQSWMINRRIICFVFSHLISNHKLIFNYDIRYEELQGISLYWDFYIYVKPLLRVMQSINQNSEAYLIPSTSVASKFPRPCVLDFNIMYVWLLILCRDETWNNEAWESLGNLISEKWRALEGVGGAEWKFRVFG